MANEALPKLLRAIAGGTSARECKHDLILNAAADKLERVQSALLECETYFEDRADVVDGSYGEPAPNKEMQLLTEIREALGNA